MRGWVGYVLAWFLGVTVTVGTYETLRLVRATMKAMTVASAQFTGERINPLAQKQLEIKQAIEKKGEGAVERSMLEKKEVLIAKVEARVGDRARAVELVERYLAMSPDEQKAVRERKLLKRKRGLGRGKGRQRQNAGGAMRDPALAGAGKEDGEGGRDTAIPLLEDGAEAER